MSIASRITEMEQHIGNAYDKIEDLGIDLTDVDKNIDNIASMLEDVWNEYPKVTATDVEEATLNGTKKGRMEIDLKGNTAQDGEPTPETPVPIKNVTGQANVKIQNKNLAWNGWAEDFVSKINNINQARLETKDNKNCLRYGAAAGYGDYDNKYMFKIPFKPNTQYTFVFDLLAKINTGNIAIQYTDNTTTSLTNIPVNSWNKVILASVANKTIKYLRVQYNNGACWMDLDTFMVLEGAFTAETIPEYVPHQEQNLPLTLGNIELNKIDTEQDYFYKQNEKWYKHEAIKKIILNETLGWLQQSSEHINICNCYFPLTPFGKAVPNSNSLCTIAKKGSAGSNNDSIKNICQPNSVGGNFLLDLSKEEFKNVNALINYLTNNNAELYYILITPVDIEITDTTLIEQLEAIKQARSYDDQTNISSTSVELGFKMDVESLSNGVSSSNTRTLALGSLNQGSLNNIKEVDTEDTEDETSVESEE